jgi:hypothetical protein
MLYQDSFFSEKAEIQIRFSSVATTSIQKISYVMPSPKRKRAFCRRATAIRNETNFRVGSWGKQLWCRTLLIWKTSHGPHGFLASETYPIPGS